MNTPQWIFMTPPLNGILSDEIASILRKTTGEHLIGERIGMLPLAENGIILLKIKDNIEGALLWMKTDQRTARVLGFGIHPELQGKGLGSKCWNIFTEEIIRQGMKNITLEVRKSNEKAINFYRRRGLIAKGWIEDYYLNEKGVLMELSLI